MESTNDIIKGTLGAMKTLKSVHWAAERCGVSAWSIRRMCHAKLIPFIPMGNRPKFDPEEIEQWLKKKTIKEKM